MIRLGFIFIFLLTGRVLFGQNIYTALQLNQPEDFKRNKIVKEVEEQHISIDSGVRRRWRYKKVFNHHYLIQTEELLDETGKLFKQKTSKNFDSTGLKTVSRKIEIRNSIFSDVTCFYGYDANGHLISMTDRNSEGQRF